MRILLAHPGTQHAFQLARELDSRGILGEFWTGLAFAERSWAAAGIQFARRFGALAGLASRMAVGIDPRRVRAVPLNELRALWRLRRGDESHAVLHQRNERFQRAIPTASIARFDAIIGFDTSSWLLAERARAASRPLLLDRSIAHPAFIARSLAELHRQYPAWVPAVDRHPAKVAEAEDREHTSATGIVVGSAFARDTLIQEGVASEKIHVNPYGVDWTTFGTTPATTSAEHRPLRFLFVGSVIARKGVPVLLEAWRRFAPRNAELWLVGSCDDATRALIPALPGLRIVGRIPHRDLPTIYGQADVLVLPSLVEGFSLVLLEALAAGLAIIATPNTGAADLMVHPRLGIIVPALSVDALEQAMQKFVSSPPVRSEIRQSARALREVFSWAAYGDRWEALLQRAVP